MRSYKCIFSRVFASAVAKALIGGGGGGGIFIYLCSAQLISFELNLKKQLISKETRRRLGVNLGSVHRASSGKYANIV